MTKPSLTLTDSQMTTLRLALLTSSNSHIAHGHLALAAEDSALYDVIVNAETITLGFAPVDPAALQFNPPAPAAIQRAQRYPHELTAGQLAEKHANDSPLRTARIAKVVEGRMAAERAPTIAPTGSMRWGMNDEFIDRDPDEYWSDRG